MEVPSGVKSLAAMCVAAKPSKPMVAAMLCLAIMITMFAVYCGRGEPASNGMLDGFNIIVSPDHPLGSAAARLALSNAKRLGARAVALVPFLWQSTPESPDLVRGAGLDDDELRAGIRDAKALGLAVVIKPHVWVPGSWAGTITMTSEAAWQKWFANYRRDLGRIAQIAEEEKADALAIGTELLKTTQRSEWNAAIGDARAIYSGRLVYVAHDIEEAEQVPFWSKLDDIGVSLYPRLGADGEREGRRLTMRLVADHLDALAARSGKSVIVGEIGLRSARGAAAKPWESVEERSAAPDPALQAEVIGDWLSALARPAIRGILVWRWFTDPDAGGLNDTDFTVQGKPAEYVLRCAWARSCDSREPRTP
jgi:hypothetical protein